MNKIEQLKRIVNNFQYEEIDGVIVDVQSASAILTVYDALGEENKKNFVSHNIDRMADIAWRLVS